ncbi:MAG: GlxA family transcriptional regulator [Sandaracinaceae bacterium]
MERRVAVLLVEGYTDSTLAVLMDVLRAANALAGPTFRVTLCSAEGGPLTAASGLTSASTRTLRSARNADVVVLPGIWAESPREIDAVLARGETQALARAAKSAHARGALVAASCSGVFVLADAGVLDGARATTAWWLAPHLRRRCPRVEVDAKASLVVGSNVVCAGAVFGVADLALHLVARFLGPAIAHRCANVLLLAPHPSQAPYMAVHQLGHNDRVVRDAETWVRANLARAFDVRELARGVGTSPRTLARRLDAAVGMSPIRFVQHLRVEMAVHLLHTTRRGIDEIARDVGYADANTLRRLLRRDAHATPRELRARRPTRVAS